MVYWSAMQKRFRTTAIKCYNEVLTVIQNTGFFTKKLSEDCRSADCLLGAIVSADCPSADCRTTVKKALFGTQSFDPLSLVEIYWVKNVMFVIMRPSNFSPPCPRYI